MIYWLSLIIGGLAVLIAFWPGSSKSNRKYYLEESVKTLRVDSIEEAQQAVNLQSLSDKTWHGRLLDAVTRVQRQIGQLAAAKIGVYMLALAFAANAINDAVLRGNLLLVLVIVECMGLLLGYLWLQKREKTQFDESFPDALNMLASAVSAGESITHAIIYVGKTLEDEVGKEFARMGDRLQLGESADSVFRKSCARFPYPAFHFFVITLRANIQRGGQLKDVITRLNRLMFDNRAIEKKKLSLTAEARASAKIVAAIPFLFMFGLQFFSPQNYEFIMFDDAGRPLLYYLIISEAIGLGIVWMLMRGAQQ
ncbi:MAG: type II secretion system F family protein [Shewanella sp.]|nr:type II secretion system F family protein [Shewanella sp.]